MDDRPDPRYYDTFFCDRESRRGPCSLAAFSQMGSRCLDQLYFISRGSSGPAGDFTDLFCSV